ncbi:hypothetical protein MCOR15_011898 [Pyricularia oryzae]|nr:hypothetical protein MCOR15_011898 [Pyricularia oryzae]
MAVLVGIGGGVPRAEPSDDPTEDVHLGDVVVGWPGDGGPACIYYDSGRWHTDGEFEVLGTINRPDQVLLNALGKLVSDHEMDISTFDVHRKRLLQSKHNRKFTFPGLQRDQLFNASYQHAGIPKNKCASCDSSQLVQRPERTEEETTGFIFHRGRIATGNAVVKDGERRDQIRELCNGALCIEMEAAGVDAGRSCLVIRGISDYADSHKDDIWRSYAAGNAAVFARELLSKIPPSSVRNLAIEVHFSVPFSRNEHFVGREEILGRLLKRLPPIAHPDACQRTVIHGLGGIGKTQVAIEAAYRVRDAYPECSVFWVPAVDMTMFENAYREIGQSLEIQGIEDDDADVKTLVKAALSRNDAKPWLLIIDNVDDLQLLMDGRVTSHVPFSRKGSILFTTRNRQITAHLQAREGVFDLAQLSDDESRQLLHQGLQTSQIGDERSTNKLLEYLVCLPLAIRQASAYMQLNVYMTIAKYLEICKASNQNMIAMLSRDFGEQDRYEKTANAIATTWLISFEQIARDAPLAASYLRNIAYFAEKDIPISLLPDGRKDWDKGEAVSVLKGYAFILDRGTANRFDIHRLVHIAMRNWIQTQGNQGEQVTGVVCQLSEMFPWPTHENRDVWTSYLPHAQTVLEFRGYCMEKEMLGLLQHNVAEVYNFLGQYEEAEQMHRETLALREKVLGPEHPSTFDSINNLALLFASQGKYQEAEQMHRKTLEFCKKAMGPEHPSTLDSMNNLASVLASQGKYEEAEQMHRKELALSEKVLGPENPSTLTSMNNLALVLNSQGKYEEAEQMHRNTLALSEKVLGPEHPSTFSSMNNLASVFDNQGKYEEAEQMHRKTLALREKVLGPEHPSTFSSMNNLASVLDNQGKYEEAEQMHRKELELCKKVLGPEHPSTLTSMNNLASVFDNQGKYEEAEQMHRKTLALREKVLGPEHPSTLTSMNNLASVFDNQGKYEEAEQMHRETLALREKVLGPEHPSTFDSMNNLALLFASQGKYQEAEQMHRKTLALYEKVLGPEHPSTLTSMNNLASVLNNQRKYEEAGDIYRRIQKLNVSG